MTNHETTLLQVKGISKTYRLGAQGVAALNNISLTLYQGELAAIVGPSGSGKTTLAHILGGLIKPDSGEVIVDGAPLSRRSDALLSRYRNQTVGFVFQNFNLLPYYNTAENVSLPLVVAKIPVKQRLDRAMQCLDLLGIKHKARSRVTELSGGERQRVAIARALVHNPRIIIADEPTGSLDSTRAQEIMTILKDLCRKKGVTVVMVTHDAALAAQADRIIRILDGKLQGDPA